MKTVGIIAEFNPFHNGHKYLIDTVRNLTSADYVVIIMSGAFTQRGTPAWMHKYDRTRIALNCGADCIIELPTSYSTATAETFAYGAVTLLDSLKCIDYLAFGSECGDIDVLSRVADELLNPTDEYKNRLALELSKGLSFPLARANAMKSYKDILNQPNNILGIEYIKALKTIQSSITPITISRKGNGYHDLTNSTLPSSATIRNMTLQNEDSDPVASLQDMVPSKALEIMHRYINLGETISINDFDDIIHHSLLCSDVQKLSNIQDINLDLANRIINNLPEYTDISSFILKLKTKELTYTRISRSVIHILLNMTDLTHNADGQLVSCPYAKILGFKKQSQPIMHQISLCSKLPLITKSADASKLMDADAYRVFEATIRADRIYNIVSNKKAHTHHNDEYKLSPVIL